MTEHTILTDEQVNTAFLALVGLEARTADLQVVDMMGGTPEACAEYLWDHFMGEPDVPTVEDLTKRILTQLRGQYIHDRIKQSGISVHPDSTDQLT